MKAATRSVFQKLSEPSNTKYWIKTWKGEFFISSLNTYYILQMCSPRVLTELMRDDPADWIVFWKTMKWNDSFELRGAEK